MYLHTELQMADTQGKFNLNFLLKQIVPCLHVLVLLVNTHLPYNAKLMEVISDALSLIISYRKINIS